MTSTPQIDYTAINARNGKGFNLIDDPWLPFGRKDVSIKKALTKAHKLAGWPVLNTPQINAAAIRLLTAIAYRIFGIGDDEAEYADDLEPTIDDLLARGEFGEDDVNAYLNRWRNRFWLLPPAGRTDLRPFLQDQELAELGEIREDSGIVLSRLIPDASPGYVWGQQQVEPPTAAEAARHLLAFMYYGPGGGGPKHPLAPDKIDGKDYNWQTGRLRGKASIHPRGRSLYETLVLHLVPLNTTGGSFRELGKPEWELNAPPGIKVPLPPPDSLLEQLFGRWEQTALLIASPGGDRVIDAKLATGRRRDDEIPESDPYTLRREGKSKEGDRTVQDLKPDTSRGVWRDLPNLRQRKRESPTAVVDARMGLPGEVSEWTLVSHVPDRASDIAWWQSSIPAISLLDDGAFYRCCAFVQDADKICGYLRRQMDAAAKAAESGRDTAKRCKAVAEGIYWSALEARFAAAVSQGHDPDDLVADARAAFDEAIEPLLNGRKWDTSRGKQHKQAPLASVIAWMRHKITAPN